jgi:hypothetical protein
MSEPTLEDNDARGLVEEEGTLSACFFCGADIYIFDERFRYCAKCVKEGK